jgi:aryl-alcohol dehydrogenase-like predicted oxidoreductase
VHTRLCSERERVTRLARRTTTPAAVGITLLDNAAVYGRNWGGKDFGAAEELLGAVLARTPALRVKVCVAT